jgi:hypothetical protein
MGGVSEELGLDSRFRLLYKQSDAYAHSSNAHTSRRVLFGRWLRSSITNRAVAAEVIVPAFTPLEATERLA